MWMTLRFIFLVYLITNLSGSIAQSGGIAAAGSKVAIVDLFNLSGKAEYDNWSALWGRGVRRALFAEKDITVIPQTQISSAISELKIDTSYITADQVPPIAKKVGADFIVLGSFTVSRDMIAASVKAVDAKTGKLLKDETRFGDVSNPNDFVKDLSSAVSKILLGREPVESTPVADSEPPAAPSGPAASPEPASAPSAPAIDSAPMTSAPPAADPFASVPYSGSVLPSVDKPPVSAPIMPSTQSMAPVEESAGNVWQPAAPAPSVPGQSFPTTAGPKSVASAPAQTFMNRPIESEIPSLPRAGAPPQQQVSSPFQPMPVIPAPPPPRNFSAQSPMMGMGQQGMAPMPSSGMMQPQQQMAPLTQPAAPEPGFFGKAWNFVSSPFKKGLAPPAQPQPQQQAYPQAQQQQMMYQQQQAMQQQQRMQQQAMPPPQSVATPAPEGNAISRFFGRLF